MVIAGGSSADLEALACLGAPVKKHRKECKEGGGLTASGGRTNMSSPINQPHPNAAKLWVNWWLSQEGQTLMHTTAADARPTLRVDVTDWGHTKEEERRVEGNSYYFFTTDPEYVLQRAEADNYVTTAYEAAR